MRRCDPLRPIALGFLRRPINYYPWIVLVQPWLETALALASRRLAKRKRPTFR